MRPTPVIDKYILRRRDDAGGFVLTRHEKRRPTGRLIRLRPLAGTRSTEFCIKDHILSFTSTLSATPLLSSYDYA